MIRPEKHTNYETTPPVKMRFWKGLGVPLEKAAGEFLLVKGGATVQVHC
jgi:hypothetical protein